MSPILHAQLFYTACSHAPGMWCILWLQWVVQRQILQVVFYSALISSSSSEGASSCSFNKLNGFLAVLNWNQNRSDSRPTIEQCIFLPAANDSVESYVTKLFQLRLSSYFCCIFVQGDADVEGAGRSMDLCSFSVRWCCLCCSNGGADHCLLRVAFEYANMLKVQADDCCRISTAAN